MWFSKKTKFKNGDYVRIINDDHEVLAGEVTKVVNTTFTKKLFVYTPFYELSIVPLFVIENCLEWASDKSFVDYILSRSEVYISNGNISVKTHNGLLVLDEEKVQLIKNYYPYIFRNSKQPTTFKLISTLRSMKININ